jgi:hypothetical protein
MSRLVGSSRTVRGDDFYSRRRQVQLFGGDLPQGGSDALAEFGFAREDGRAAFRINSYPGVEQREASKASGQVGRHHFRSGSPSPPPANWLNAREDERQEKATTSPPAVNRSRRDQDSDSERIRNLR